MLLENVSGRRLVSSTTDPRQAVLQTVRGSCLLIIKRMALSQRSLELHTCGTSCSMVRCGISVTQNQVAGEGDNSCTFERLYKVHKTEKVHTYKTFCASASDFSVVVVGVWT